MSAGSAGSGALLLADISGYTRFLQDVADTHRDLIVEAPEPPPAYALISTLLDATVEALEPAFRLVKFEGDAVFALAEDGGSAPRGAAVVEILGRCHDAFHRQLDAAGDRWVCRCDACARIGALDLKFILHYGSFVEQRMAGREEILGPDVNLVHRLLKNGARAVVGDDPYALITAAAVAALEMPTDGLPAIRETYPDVPPIDAVILRLDG